MAIKQVIVPQQHGNERVWKVQVCNEINKLWDALNNGNVAPSYTVANLPASPDGNYIAYASNGRKAGEGVGAGTGVLCFHDGSNWIAADTGATVAA